ncbi:MAG: GNAT family N-acetyltransferase [Burkholderiales bacterium]|jgi:ribosomal protein S18 acetylase RimI-like enzyme
MLTIHQAQSSGDIDTARELFREYQALLGVDLCFQGFAAELEGLPGDYAPPRGRLLLAADDGVPVGCVALRPLSGARCEMKRLFVRPAARGLGAGRALVTRITDEARALGYGEMVLDTLPAMAAAQHLYQAFGFRDIPQYCENPIPGARYLGRSLADPELVRK